MRLSKSWTTQDLAQKIEYEGGVAEFFFHYSGPKEWEGTILETEVTAAYEAYKNLRKKLDKIGALL